MRNNSFCAKCGAPIQPGSRFCDNCGTPVNGFPGNMDDKTVWDPDPLPGGQGWGPEVPQDFDGEKNNTVKWILIGAGIGLAVLLLIFGTMHFLNAADEEKEDSKAATTEQTTEEEAQDYDEPEYDEPDTDAAANRQSEQAPVVRDENNVANDYSYYRTEAQLYDPSAPVFFPDSSDRYLSDYEVSGLNEDQLQKAINDIFARDGLIFETSYIQNYYGSQTWYYGYTSDKSAVQNGFSDVEKKNIDLMRKYQ